MEILRRSFRHTLTPIAFCIFFFALISSVFAIAYIFVDYQGYIKAYRIRQAQEIATIHQKTGATFEQLGKMLSLMESRIYDAQRDVKRIQRILSSVHQLQNAQSFPEIQRVSFYKVTSPQMIITRYGEAPLEARKMAVGTTTLKDREPTFHAEHKSLKGRMPVLGLDGTLDGVLEFQILLAEFWKFLGTYEAVSFDQRFLESINHSQEGGPFFHLRENPPKSFCLYSLAHRSTYTGLGCYLLFSLFLMGFCLYFLDAYFQRNFGKKGLKLEKALLHSKIREKASREELWVHKQDAQSHQTSCQLQKKLQMDIKTKRYEYGRYLVQSLEILEKSYQNPLSALTESDRVDIVNLCRRQAKPYAMGLWEPTNKEEVDLEEIIHNIPLLFAERVDASNVSIEVDIPSGLIPIIQGETVFMEILLINAIGKLIYRVPKGGKVLISLREEDRSFQLEIQDNGYALAETTEKLLKKSFDFIMEDGTFQQACRENGITYKASTGKSGGMNVTRVMLPLSQVSQEDIANSNVVPLFR